MLFDIAMQLTVGPSRHQSTPVHCFEFQKDRLDPVSSYTGSIVYATYVIIDMFCHLVLLLSSREAVFRVPGVQSS